MTKIVLISRSDLIQRRRTLRHQRRIQVLQFIWRTLAVSGLLGGLVWATTLPIWVVRESSQVTIEGNHLLSEKVIRSHIPLKLPQSLLRIEPEAIARSLEVQPPIADATVTRRLFPPGITVHIEERIPVALGINKLLKGTSTPTPKASMGLLDQDGVWIPLQSYAFQERPLKLPNLKIIGLPQDYRPYWTQLYQTVSQSNIKITEIDCRNPANLILKTQLGTVYIGAYSPEFPHQIQVLENMRQLSTQVKPSQIAYIDLTNPETPLVQTLKPKKILTSENK